MSASASESGVGRTGRVLVTAAVVGALFVPVALDRDGLPLSTYPMYSSARPAEVTLVTAYGLDEAGEQVTLSLGVIGRSDDPLVVAGELRSAVRADRADDRCEEIAGRAATAGSLDDSVVGIEIVSERYDVVDRVESSAAPLDRTVHATCPLDEGG